MTKTRSEPMKDLTLIIENVRTFRGRHEISIRPLTILTGENSSGKTTLLALFSTVCDQESFPLRPDFNKPPYNLGNYETIASYDPALDTQERDFSLGFLRPDTDTHLIKSAEARYGAAGGHIRLSSFEARGKNLEFSLNQGITDRFKGTITIDFSGKASRLPFSLRQGGTAPVGPLARLVLDAARQARPTHATDWRTVLELSEEFGRLAPADAVSLAPTRTRPQRVYSQITEVFKPTGDHIPFFLERLMDQDRKSPERLSLLHLLTRFGSDSGLFHGVQPSRFGDRPGAPFELRVGLATTTINLADVGYGISQILPVIVEAATASNRQFLLLQQPEIHLHPRAQAALGTLFADIVSAGHCRMIVETHSDYLIDRIRQEIAAGKISPDMVALIYFHRELLKTEHHLIELDRLGNLIDPPDSYRSFFLEEEWRLLRRGARH